MSWDKVNEAYIDECNCLLRKLQSTLIRLSETPDDPDLIEELAGYINVIKGKSSFFDYQNVVEFTYQIERTIHFIKVGRLTVSDDLVTVLSKCNDQIKRLAFAATLDNSLVDETLFERSLELSDRLIGYHHDCSCESSMVLDRENSVSCKKNLISHINTPEQVVINSINACSVEKQVEQDSIHISLRFSHDLLRKGIDPLTFLHDLEGVGDSLSVKPVMTNIPSLEEMDADCCYLGLDIDINRASGQKEAESAFAHLLEDISLHLSPESRSEISNTSASYITKSSENHQNW